MQPLPQIERYVAIGDSQTEGLHDYYADGSPRGWADRFAEAIAAQHPEIRYANLAVRGKRSAEIRAAQLEPALALEPDLVTVMSGVNDVVDPRSDLDAVAGEIEAMYAALRATGCRVVSCTFPPPQVGITKRVAPRVRALNALIRAAAARHGIALVDLEPLDTAADLRIWNPDRIHLNPIGHACLAEGFLVALADSDDESWTSPLPPQSAGPGRVRQAAAEAAWAARYLAPKVVRMLRGKSTGDGRVAKRPELLPVVGSGTVRGVGPDIAADMVKKR